MYVLRIENEKELEKAKEILRDNGIKADKDSALKIVCFEEACSIVESQYDHFTPEQKDSLVDCLTHELFEHVSCIFDDDYIVDTAANIARIVSEDK